MRIGDQQDRKPPDREDSLGAAKRAIQAETINRLARRPAAGERNVDGFQFRNPGGELKPWAVRADVAGTPTMDSLQLAEQTSSSNAPPNQISPHQGLRSLP
jgi:hypothetical protein